MTLCSFPCNAVQDIRTRVSSGVIAVHESRLPLTSAAVAPIREIVQAQLNLAKGCTGDWSPEADDKLLAILLGTQRGAIAALCTRCFIRLLVCVYIRACSKHNICSSHVDMAKLSEPFLFLCKSVDLPRSSPKRGWAPQPQTASATPMWQLVKAMEEDSIATHVLSMRSSNDSCVAHVVWSLCLK